MKKLIAATAIALTPIAGFATPSCDQYAINATDVAHMANTGATRVEAVEVMREEQKMDESGAQRFVDTIYSIVKTRGYMNEARVGDIAHKACIEGQALEN